MPMVNVFFVVVIDIYWIDTRDMVHLSLSQPSVFFISLLLETSNATSRNGEFLGSLWRVIGRQISAFSGSSNNFHQCSGQDQERWARWSAFYCWTELLLLYCTFNWIYIVGMDTDRSMDGWTEPDDDNEPSSSSSASDVGRTQWTQWKVPKSDGTAIRGQLSATYTRRRTSRGDTGRMLRMSWNFSSWTGWTWTWTVTIGSQRNCRLFLAIQRRRDDGDL